MEKPMAVWVRQAERILAAANEGNSRLMFGYMKRYDAGNRLVREMIREWQRDDGKGELLYIRCHGFCGNWIAGLDASGLIRPEESVEPLVVEELLPDWLQKKFRGGYIGYFQENSHQVTL